MAQVKISQLQQVSSLSGTELLPVVQSSTTKSCTPNQIFNSNKSSTWTNTRVVATDSSGKLTTTSTTPTALSTGLQNASDALNGVNTINNKVATGQITSPSVLRTDSGTICSSKQVLSGSETALGTVAFTFKGFAVLVVSASVQANTSGYRTLKVGSSTVTVAPSPSGVTRMQCVELVRGTSTGIDVTFTHNAGTNVALNVTASYELLSIDRVI